MLINVATVTCLAHDPFAAARRQLPPVTLVIQLITKSVFGRTAVAGRHRRDVDFKTVLSLQPNERARTQKLRIVRVGEDRENDGSHKRFTLCAVNFLIDVYANTRLWATVPKSRVGQFADFSDQFCIVAAG